MKKISWKGRSTEIIGIFTLAGNPVGTAESDILTLLHDFAITHKPLKLRPLVKYCKKSFFTSHFLRYWR